MEFDDRLVEGFRLERITPSRSWRVVSLLSLLYMVSAVDRLIPGLLGPALKVAYRLDNASLGLLIGTTFAALYSLAGLPVARAIDLGARKRIVVGGVLLWSSATMASAFAPTFQVLLACRAGVAIGEAVLTPAAISMIGDLFTRERRVRPTAVFVSTGAIAGMAASALGSGVYALAQALSTAAGLAPWRLTLIMLGGVGFLGAAVFALMVTEPARIAEQPPGPAASGAATTPWRLYLLTFGAVGVCVMLTYSMLAWLPTILMERFKLGAPAAGLLVGGVAAASGLLGMSTTPWVIERGGRTGRHDAMFSMGIVLLAIACVGLAVTALASTIYVTAVGVALIFGSLSSFTLFPSFMVQRFGPAVLRGRLMAIYLLVANLLGLGIGPVLTGFLSDRVFPGVLGLGRALAVLGAADLCIAFLLFLMTSRDFRALRSRR